MIKFYLIQEGWAGLTQAILLYMNTCGMDPVYFHHLRTRIILLLFETPICTLPLGVSHMSHCSLPHSTANQSKIDSVLSLSTATLSIMYALLYICIFARQESFMPSPRPPRRNHSRTATYPSPSTLSSSSHSLSHLEIFPPHQA